MGIRVECLQPTLKYGRGPPVLNLHVAGLKRQNECKLWRLEKPTTGRRRSRPDTDIK